MHAVSGARSNTRSSDEVATIQNESRVVTLLSSMGTLTMTNPLPSVAPGAASLFPVALPVPTSTPVVSSYADTVYVIPLQLGATVPIANVSVPVV